MRSETPLEEPDPAFLIRCEGCVLPAVWLPDAFVPTKLAERGEKVRFLGVLGYHTPSRNIKYLPALKGVAQLVAAGFAGRRERVLVPSSGNFLSSAHEVVKELGVDIELIGVVSSKLPAGKRRDLERRGILLMTEFDLADELGLQEKQETFEMLQAYSRATGIPILDQYGCDADPENGWNRSSYLPIAEEVLRQTGGEVSLFVTTAGTKGKYGIGVELRRHNPDIRLVVAFPYPGERFEGGRDEEDILHVKNPFGIEPIRRSTDRLVASNRSAKLALEGIPGGITFGAELGTAQHFLLEMYRDDRLSEMRRADGSIVVLLVCSDTIYPYIEEGMQEFPHLYGKIPNPYA